MSTVAAPLVLDLEKGQRVTLDENKSNVFSFGCGWEKNKGNQSADVDAFCILLGANKKLWKPSPESILFFNSPKDANNMLNVAGGALTHSGDNLTGEGEGDDEVITMHTDKMPADLAEVLLFVNIFSATNKAQNFGMIKSCNVNLYDFAAKAGVAGQVANIATYNVSDKYEDNTAVCVGRIYKSDAGIWKFEAVSKGLNGSITDIANQYI